MSNPMEPTEEHLRAMFCARIGREWAPEWERNWSTSGVREELAREFAVVRDLVIEEAEKVCDAVYQSYPPASGGASAAVICVSRVRALKEPA